MNKITWYYNKLGHLQLYDGECSLKELELRECDRYITVDYDIEDFFHHIGLIMNCVELGDWDITNDPGYFN